MKSWGVILIVAGSLLLNGCASEKQAADAPASPTTPSGTDGRDNGGTTTDTNGDGIPDAPTGTGETPSQTGFSSGSTATMNASTGQLARMFVNSYPNNPQNVRVNIDLRRTRDAIIISYVDNGREVRAGLGTLHPCDYDGRYGAYTYGCQPGRTNAQFNGWVNQGGQSVWKGFFQDQYGAIVVVVDKMLSQGDGQPGNILGGSIWFQNFSRAYPNAPYQGSNKMCWEITMGPYDCRSFLVSGNVQMASSFYPNNKGPNASMNYEMLGEFAGISRSAAGF